MPPCDSTWGYADPFGAKQCLAGPNRYTVQMHEKKHIMLDPEYLQYINHSCRPNVFFDFRDMTLICINPIAVGDEMTFFYPSTEWAMSHGFQCQCGSHGCLGHIHGASYLSPDVLERYRLSEFIQQMYRKNNTYEPVVRQERMAFK